MYSSDLAGDCRICKASIQSTVTPWTQGLWSITWLSQQTGPLRTVLGAAHILIWLELHIDADALRFVSSRDMKYAAHLKQKASSGALTSYGQPAGTQVLTREIAVDHFGKVLARFRSEQAALAITSGLHWLSTGVISPACFLQAQYTGNDTYQLRLGLIGPETEPNDSTPIFLFVGEETPIE